MTDIRPIRRLAAAVIKAATDDYKRALNCGDRTVRIECARFLASPTIWHQIVGIRPEYCARWLEKQRSEARP